MKIMVDVPDTILALKSRPELLWYLRQHNLDISTAKLVDRNQARNGSIFIGDYLEWGIDAELW